MKAQRKARARILVVEDDAIVGEDLREELRGLGYEVVAVVRNGADAVRAAREHAPDLALMDIRMPGRLDGVDAARRIGDQTSVPVVYLTAHSDARTVARARKTDPLGYVLKPVDRDQLAAAVEIAVHGDNRDAGPGIRWFRGTAGGVLSELGSTDGPEDDRGGPATPVDLTGIVDGVHADLAGRMGPGRDLFLSVSGGPYFVDGRLSELDQVVRMLVMGARDSISRAGRVDLRLEKAEPPEVLRVREGRSAGGWVCLSVAVEGPGRDSVQPEGRRSGRRDDPDEGEPARIATIYRVVRSLGGHVRIATEAAGRAVVQVFLPRSGPSPDGG